MAYLLAKYSLLFLITAILGFVFGYWWSRRNFVDVTESFEDLRTANDRSDRANWAQLWKRLDMMPAPVEPDFSPTNRRIDEIESAISQLPRVEPASVTGIQQQLKDLLGLVRQMSCRSIRRHPLSSRCARRLWHCGSLSRVQASERRRSIWRRCLAKSNDWRTPFAKRQRRNE